MKMPVLFVGHGSPMVAVEDDAYTEALAQWGQRLPRPRALVTVSAHWESDRPLRVTSAEKPDLIYDFSGFPPELYDLTYPAPGDPRLAEQIAAILSHHGTPCALDVERGIDHGAWIPMRRIFPQADIPLLQLTLPMPRHPEELMALGQALAPLRSEGVLLVGSGNVVHNLRRVHFGDKHGPVDEWANEFDDWFEARLEKRAREDLINYRKTAPNAALAAPTTEHFDPVFFVLGGSENDPRTDLFKGFHYGNLSMRTFIFG